MTYAARDEILDGLEIVGLPTTFDSYVARRADVAERLLAPIGNLLNR